ncbi:hypothetical protein M1B72_22030 [Geomonas paludis]|uniref:Uncharacterized protein n=1 Tax=Geomonas paludis TaxID=2740185 RepID=A0A6V8MRP8_9BACT|nr:hypothetical protein [Geomonas paludis]UPU36080.1 hypothetical protein M1B72_22030 [Geomonas paludis]GFO62313.1 hypothetical protein GMPD_02320 [Geomonas paludis]
MAATLDLKKINKTIKIFAVAQFGLIAILIYTAINFQQRLQAVGRGHRFMNGVIYAFVIQLLFFYPIFRFASKEAERDLSLAGKVPTQEETKEFAKKKRWADVTKIAVMGFYFIFALAAPADPFILSVIIYSFLLTILTYLQCYSFAVRKISKPA